jgi:type I restriction enzyme R subunit
MAVQYQRITEANEAEEPAKELLRKLGYVYVPRDLLWRERDDGREVLLKARLRLALLRLNDWLTADLADRAIAKLEHVDQLGMARNRLVHEYLTYGMPLDVDESGGRRTRTVNFLDFDHPEPETGRNEYVVTTQMRVRRGQEREGRAEDDEKLVIPDLVLFVNGIPLVVAEAKSGTLIGDVWRARAVRQLRRYQEATAELHGMGAPELFAYNLLCVALGGAAAAYGAVGAAEHEYAAWKSIAPYDEDELRSRFGVAPVGQAQLIVGLLAPATLLDVLRDFVIYEPDHGRLIKKLPRYQQHRAVTAAMRRILAHPEPEKRGGVVWHTQGSGKSLTMLWLATKLRRESRLRNPMIVIVTDRTQLDEQITQTFQRSGFPAPEHADRGAAPAGTGGRPAGRDGPTSERARNTLALRDLLASNAGHTVLTTVQKFEDALDTPAGDLDALNPADNVFVMVDEAHRTQYGLLAARMRKALPRATFVGFTGTPIDQDFRRGTMRQFGPLIDAYTIPQSVEDGATVPIYYEARLPELSIQGPNTLDKLFDAMFGDKPPEVQARIRRRYANKEQLAEAERRIEMIALDVADHFKSAIRPNRFKAQLVAPSRRAAVRYAAHLNDFGLQAFPIITTDRNDGPEFKEARELPQGQVISQFKDPAGPPEMLVVVDMLLTGFDAPVEQVLYLDRGLREHGLLQAIARVNRPCRVERPGGGATEKGYGLVVDYWGVSRELESALALFEKRDTREVWRELPDDPRPVIEAAARQAESHFKGRDLADPWSCVLLFAADATTFGDFKADAFERFDEDYRAFASLMDRFLPDPRALAYRDRLARLTQIRAYARATFLRQDASLDWADVSAKVKKLIDDRIDAQVRELMKPVSILDEDFEEKIGELPHEEARASVMEHAIRAQITERLAENPAFYERLSEQLARIIAEMRQHVIDAATAVQLLRQLRTQALSAADVAAQQGLTEVSFAVYELLEQASADGAGPPSSNGVREGHGPYRAGLDKRLKSVALSVEAIVARGQAIVDWHNKEDVQRVMRRDIKRELRQLEGLTEEQLNELAASIVEIARQQTIV